MNEQYRELYEKLSRLQWLLHRHHLQTHAERGPMADPTRGQGRVLAMLKLQPQISTKDLSYLLGIRQQSLNELLGKLEKAEYVTRVPSESDRRVMLVTLTEKGRQQEQAAEPDLGDILDCLSQPEQLAFGEYLDRVIAALESRLGVEGEEMEAWQNAARSRMGDEMFERLRSMRHGGHPGRRDIPWEGGPHRGPCGPGHPPHGPQQGPHHPGGPWPGYERGCDGPGPDWREGPPPPHKRDDVEPGENK